MKMVVVAAMLALALAACGTEDYGKSLGNIPADAVINRTTEADSLEGQVVKKAYKCLVSEDELVVIQDGSVIGRNDTGPVNPNPDGGPVEYFCNPD